MVGRVATPYSPRRCRTMTLAGSLVAVRSSPMATILIVEDRPVDRKLLAMILRAGGHDVIEATDGEEALRTLAGAGAQLVISDILMPTVDGYEFVRRMREDPALASIPVVFYTATYHEREARALANRCGVVDILMKPSAPKRILATVDAVIASTAPTDVSVDRQTFDREHLHLVSSTLAARIDRFQAEQLRTAAVAEVSQQIASEHDPVALLHKLCRDGREVTLAQHAVVGLLSPKGVARDRLYSSGLDDETAVGMKPPSVQGGVIGTVLGERRPVRARNPDGRPEALGLPADDPPVSSLLSVPIASSSHVYGWLSLRNKLGADEFSDADERAAVVLGAHAGIAYENATLLDDLRRRIVVLEEERQRTSLRVREEERAELSRTLHDQIGQTLAGLKMDLAWLSAQIESSPSSNKSLIDKAEAMRLRLDETIQFVRSTATELRPGVLDKLGLVAAIEWQVAEFERRSGIRSRVDTRIDHVDLDRDRSAAAFRVVQEALDNALQHANATRVTVSVRGSAERLTVSIADNGRGISDGEIASRESLGLMGMRERAALLGGSLEVRRRRPAGTLVKLTVPLAGSPHGSYQ
jgi:signal transduction histidine kinase